MVRNRTLAEKITSGSAAIVDCPLWGKLDRTNGSRRAGAIASDRFFEPKTSPDNQEWSDERCRRESAAGIVRFTNDGMH